jgi:hypothetical protein
MPARIVFGATVGGIHNDGTVRGSTRGTHWHKKTTKVMTNTKTPTS